MALEDELNAMARPRARTFSETEIRRLLEDARGVCIELAQVLLRKGVHTQPIEVPGEATSKVKQWLWGHASNPTIRVGDCWELRPSFYLDTQGSLWAIEYVLWPGQPDTDLPHPEMRKVDMHSWPSTFAKPRNNWVSCGGAHFRRKVDDSGESYIEMSYRYFDGIHEEKPIHGPFRDMMLKAAAQLIR